MTVSDLRLQSLRLTVPVPVVLVPVGHWIQLVAYRPGWYQPTAHGIQSVSPALR